jgi:DNA polymerase-4
MPTGQRKIIHIDMDAFYASVEQRDNPQLRNRPVAVGGANRRGVVAAASYEARRFGVHSAQSSVIAKQKCPQLIFVSARFEVYRSVSAEIHAVMRRYTDVIEPLSLDEAYLDVTENKQGLGSATEIAQYIRRDIRQQTGLTASAGVSVNKFLAKVASDYDKPDGLFVIKPAQVEQFIDRLKIEKFFGVGKVTAQKMHGLGIYQGKDLKQWPLAELIRHFGKAGKYYYDIAHGIDDRPVQPKRERKSIGAEHTFSENLDALEQLLVSLREIALEVCKRIDKAGTGGRTVTVKIKFSDFTQITRSLSVNEPVSDFDDIYSIASGLLSQAATGANPVRLLGITLSNLQRSQVEEEKQLTLNL